jgi:hypothetical protein
MLPFLCRVLVAAVNVTFYCRKIQKTKRVLKEE